MVFLEKGGIDLRIPAFLFALSRRFTEFFLVNFVISVFFSLLALTAPRLFEREFLVTFIFSFVGFLLMYAYAVLSSWQVWASVDGAWRYYLINGLAYLLTSAVDALFWLMPKTNAFFLPYRFLELFSYKFVPTAFPAGVTMSDYLATWPVYSSTVFSVVLSHLIFFATICLLPFIFHFIPINDRALPKKRF